MDLIFLGQLFLLYLLKICSHVHLGNTYTYYKSFKFRQEKKLDILKSLLYNHFGLLELQMTSSKDNLWFVLNLTFRDAGTIDILFPQISRI